MKPVAQPDPFWADRPVVVTGATGFVGHHLVRQLVSRGAQVTAALRASSNRARLQDVRCVTAPLDDVDALTAAFRGASIVFHVAGAVDFGGDWDAIARVNIEGTRNVLDAARSAGVNRIIHTSSIVAVGASEQPTIHDETAHWDLHRFRVPYITTKRLAEELALSQRGIEVVVVNPASIIGPDDFSGSEFGTLCRRFWRGRIPFHFGGGNNFVDVRDVAEGHLRAAEHGRAGQRYLLGGENRTMTAFFADLARSAERFIPRVRLPDALADSLAWLNEQFTRPGKKPSLTREQARLSKLYFFYSSAKARAELGYAPRPLAESLADAHAFWTRANRGRSA